MRLAGEKLSDMLHEKHICAAFRKKRERFTQSVHIAVSDLARAFDDDTEDISIRTHATIVMDRNVYVFITPILTLQGSGGNVGRYI